MQKFIEDFMFIFENKLFSFFYEITAENSCVIVNMYLIVIDLCLWIFIVLWFLSILFRLLSIKFILLLIILIFVGYFYITNL